MAAAALYKALLELREAEKAFDDARFAYNSLVMQRKRKGKQEAWEAKYYADKRVDAARDAADELLAKLSINFPPR
jgi:hypothetical protein